MFEDAVTVDRISVRMCYVKEERVVLVLVENVDCIDGTHGSSSSSTVVL